MVDFECARPYGFEDVRKLLKILRSEQGCPWDAKQTHDSIKEHLLEESCEAMEAIELGDSGLLCEELGDVLLQVVFHAAMAEERGAFTMSDVTDGLCAKLIARHPHVFADTEVNGVSEVLSNWEDIKRQKKGQASVGDAMRGVASTLPVLMRAEKLIKLAKRAGLELPEEDLRRAMALAGEAEDNLAAACQRYIESAPAQ